VTLDSHPWIKGTNATYAAYKAALRERLGKGKERPNDRTLADAELKALLTNLDDVLRSPRMACAIRILLLTGQRRGELALARRRDIDFEAKTWTIPAAHSKTGVAHLLPLSPAAPAERVLRSLQWPMRSPSASSTMLRQAWPASTTNTPISTRCGWRSTSGPSISRVFKIPAADRLRKSSSADRKGQVPGQER
jgi:integrase